MTGVKKELVNLNVRIPATLKDLIAKYIECDCHTNASDFTRDALREKLAKDAPDLYAQLYKRARAKELERRLQGCNTEKAYIVYRDFFKEYFGENK